MGYRDPVLNKTERQRPLYPTTPAAMAVLSWEAGLQILHARDMVPGSNQASVFGVGIAFSIIGLLVMALRLHCRINIIRCGLGTDDCESKSGAHLGLFSRLLETCFVLELTPLDLMIVGIITNIGLSVANMICEPSSSPCDSLEKPVLTFPRRLVRRWSPLSVCPSLTPIPDGDNSRFRTNTPAVDAIPEENMDPLLKANYATRLLYVFALFFVKMSILVFYLRIDHRRWTRWTIYFLMFTVVGLSIATACILAFECWPPSLFWNVVEAAAHPEKCMNPANRQVFYEANGIIK